MPIGKTWDSLLHADLIERVAPITSQQRHNYPRDVARLAAMFDVVQLRDSKGLALHEGKTKPRRSITLTFSMFP